MATLSITKQSNGSIEFKDTAGKTTYWIGPTDVSIEASRGYSGAGAAVDTIEIRSAGGKFKSFFVSDILNINGAAAPSLLSDLVKKLSVDVFSQGGGSGTGAVSNQEVTDYVAAHKAKGSYLTESEVKAFDRFVSLNKSNGGWDFLDYVAIPFGYTLDASLLRLKFRNNIQSNTYEGLTSADHTGKFIRIVGANPGTKIIKTGFIPNDFGISKSNITLGAVWVNEPIAPQGDGYYFADNNVGAGAGIAGGYSNIAVDVRNSSNTIGGERSQVMVIRSATSFKAYRNGVACNESDAISSLTGNLATELTYYRTLIYAATVKFSGTAPGLAIGRGMSDEQARVLSASLRQLYVDLGLIKDSGIELGLLSDSIGAVQMADTYRDGFGFITAEAMGGNLINFSQAGGLLGITFQNNTGAFQKYKDMLKVKMTHLIIQITVNDMGIDGNAASTGTPGTITGLRVQLEEIINAAKALNIKVVIGCAPYCDTSLQSLAKQIAYRQIFVLAAKNTNVIFVDNYYRILDLPDPLAVMTTDKLHYLTSGNRILADGYKMAFMHGIITRTPLLTWAAIVAGSFQTIDISLEGSVVGNRVEICKPAAVVFGIVYDAWVSATDVVTVRATNNTTGSITPAAQRQRIEVKL